MAEGGGLLNRVGPSNHIRSHSSKPGFIEVLRRQRAQHTAASCLILDGPVAIWVTIPDPAAAAKRASGRRWAAGGHAIGTGRGGARSIAALGRKPERWHRARQSYLFGFFCSRIETNYYFDDPGAP